MQLSKVPSVPEAIRCRAAGEKGAAAEGGRIADFRLVMQITSARLSHCAESYVLIADVPTWGNSDIIDFSQPMQKYCLG